MNNHADSMASIAWQLRDERPKDAQALLAAVCQANPSGVRYLRAFASVAARNQDTETAIAACLTAIALDGEHLETLCMLAELYLSTMHYRQALEHLRRCIALDPQMQHPAGLRARVLVKTALKDLSAH